MQNTIILSDEQAKRQFVAAGRLGQSLKIREADIPRYIELKEWIPGFHFIDDPILGRLYNKPLIQHWLKYQDDPAAHARLCAKWQMSQPHLWK